MYTVATNFTMLAHTLRLLFYVTKTAKIIKTNWLWLLFVVKAATLKQQISKFYPQILSTEASLYIYDRLLTDTNLMASFTH